LIGAAESWRRLVVEYGHTLQLLVETDSGLRTPMSRSSAIEEKTGVGENNFFLDYVLNLSFFLYTYSITKVRLRECYVAVTGNRARRSHLALWRRNEMRAQ
jgi:hypothetical protein